MSEKLYELDLSKLPRYELPKSLSPMRSITTAERDVIDAALAMVKHSGAWKELIKPVGSPFIATFSAAVDRLLKERGEG